MGLDSLLQEILTQGEDEHQLHAGLLLVLVGWGNLNEHVGLREPALRLDSSSPASYRGVSFHSQAADYPWVRPGKPEGSMEEYRGCGDGCQETWVTTVQG